MLTTVFVIKWKDGADVEREREFSLRKYAVLFLNHLVLDYCYPARLVVRRNVHR